jgi:uncharacterized protein (TIGR00369 family)
MTDASRLRELLASQPKPVCAALTPFEVLEADFAGGYVKVEFAEQPAFRNHFGDIQGGFGVSMIDVVISLAAYARLRQWLPTIEIKSSFVAPAKLGMCVGEGRVLRAGKNLVFLEGRLWGADGQLAIHATATAMIKSS